MQSAIGYLLSHFEGQALNQQAAGLAALALCRKLPALHVDGAQFAALADRFFAAQHEEGWFPEYGGPDIGYLTVTIDMLWDYFDASGDERAAGAIDRAIEYLVWFVAPDGSLAGVCNSRNTDYAVPYGLSRSSRRNPLAAEIVRRLLGHIEQPRHFLASVDDRYHLHYIFNSCVRSLPHLAAERGTRSSLPCDRTERRFFAGCGNLADHHGGEYAVFFAGKKGGLVSLVGPQGVLAADYGWRCRSEGRLQVSNFWNDAFQVTWLPGENVVAVSGPLVPVVWHRPSPLRHLLVRLASFFLGRKLIPLLKRWLILRDPGRSVHLTRRLHLSQPCEVHDILKAPGAVLAWRAQRPSARHVSSAGSFVWEELTPPAREALEFSGELACSRRLASPV